MTAEWSQSDRAALARQRAVLRELTATQRAERLHAARLREERLFTRTDELVQRLLGVRRGASRARRVIRRPAP